MDENSLRITQIAIFLQTTVIITIIGVFWSSMNKRFDQVEKRIDKLDEKVTTIDRRLCRLEGAFSVKNFCYSDKETK